MTFTAKRFSHWLRNEINKRAAHFLKTENHRDLGQSHGFVQVKMLNGLLAFYWHIRLCGFHKILPAERVWQCVCGVVVELFVKISKTFTFGWERYVHRHFAYTNDILVCGYRQKLSLMHIECSPESSDVHTSGSTMSWFNTCGAYKLLMCNRFLHTPIAGGSQMHLNWAVSKIHHHRLSVSVQNAHMSLYSIEYTEQCWISAVAPKVAYMPSYMPSRKITWIFFERMRAFVYPWQTRARGLLIIPDYTATRSTWYKRDGHFIWTFMRKRCYFCEKYSS